MTQRSIHYTMQSEITDLAERFVLFVLATWSNRYGYRDESMTALTLDKMSELTGLSIKGLLRVLDRLEQKGEVQYILWEAQVEVA